MLRYEDIFAEPVRELAKVASFLSVEATPEGLATAVERSSVDKMQKMEKTQGDGWVSTKGLRKDIPFIGRSAKPGGWKSELSESSVADIESAWGPLMKTLGYEVTRESCSPLEPPFVR